MFSLSLRDVALILAERGIIVTWNSIRCWCRKFGSEAAAKLRRRRPKPDDTWHRLWCINAHGFVLVRVAPD